MYTQKPYFDEEPPKAEILQAAMDEFIEFGKKGARMQSIADRANVNKALLHYYFSSKDNLHKEVLRRVFERGMSNISASLELQLEPKDQIRSLIRAYFNVIKTFPELPKLMIHEMASNPEPTADFFGKMFTETTHYPRAILDVINEGIEKKQFKPIDPKQFLITVISTIIFFFVAKPMFLRILDISDEQKFINERPDQLVEILMTGIERSI
jgi:TetR/AcrR family transcriptional regulator